MSSPIAEKSSLPSSLRGWSWPWQATESLWWGPSGLWHADRVHGPARWDGLAEWCAAHPGQRATLWLSAWWVVDVLVDAALPLHDDASLLAYVRPLLQHYHGDAAAPWPLAAWQAGPARGVSALHGLALPELLAATQAHGVRLAAVQPWWARALRLALAQQPALGREPAAQLAVVEGRLVTRLDLRRGQIVGLQQRRLAQASTTALQAWLAGEPVAMQHCLGYGLVDDGRGAITLPTLPTLSRGAPGGHGSLGGDVPAAVWWAHAANRAAGAATAAAAAAAAPAASAALTTAPRHGAPAAAGTAAIQRAAASA